MQHVVKKVLKCPQGSHPDCSWDITGKSKVTDVKGHRVCLECIRLG